MVCNSKKSRFIKVPEASGLFTRLGIRTSLSQIPLVVPILLRHQMNKLIKKALLARYKFIKTYLFQHGMAPGNSKDLPRRPMADKVSRDKAFHIAKNPIWWYQPRFASMI